jgi:hypothetical protein
MQPIAGRRDLTPMPCRPEDLIVFKAFAGRDPPAFWTSKKTTCRGPGFIARSTAPGPEGRSEEHRISGPRMTSGTQGPLRGVGRPLHVGEANEPNVQRRLPAGNRRIDEWLGRVYDIHHAHP